MSTYQETVFIIKPYAVARKLTGRIIARLDDAGLDIHAIKLQSATKKQLERHYSHLTSQPFFPKIVDTMTAGPVMVMLLGGFGNVVTKVRNLVGSTDPVKAQPGTIRGDFGIDIGRNICHASATVDEAQTEKGIWFSPEELTCPPMDLPKQLHYRD